jgi:hypothetical protein
MEEDEVRAVLQGAPGDPGHVAVELILHPLL